MQWYPGDWRKDPGVQGLDLEARGAWRECIDMMWESPQRGRLVFANGRPMSDVAIARNLGIDEAHWKQIRSKLLDYGVASQDDEGVLYNRRMVRKEASSRRLSEVRAEAGRKGGRTSKRKAKKAASSSSSSSASANSSSVSSANATETGASADVDNDQSTGNGTPLQQVMGRARELGYQCDDHDGSVAKALIEDHQLPDILTAVEGQALLVQDGRVDSPPRMTRLYSEANNVDAKFWRWCEQRVLDERKRGGPNGLSSIGNILKAAAQ
jgi:hypothetical protein